MYITRNNIRIEVEPVKKALLSRGYSVYLFRVVGGSVSLTTDYIVAVKDSDGQTCEYKNIPRTPRSVKLAVQYYMDYLCCYC